MGTKNNFVTNMMSKSLIVISSNKFLSEALYLMNKQKISSVVITKNKKIVGIIARSDLKKYNGSDFNKIKVENVMSTRIYSVSSETSLEETKGLMDRKKIDSILVIDYGKVKGIVTRYDLRTKVPQVENKRKNYNYEQTYPVQQRNLVVSGIFIIVGIFILLYFLISIIGLFTADCEYAISGFCISWRSFPSNTVQTIINGVNDITTEKSTEFSTNPIPFSEYNTIQKIYISGDVMNQLNNEWSSNGQTEFKVCAFAKKYSDSYVIDKITIPKVEYATEYAVKTEGCPYNSVGTIHSHPIGDCLPSSPSIPYIGSDVENLLKEDYPLMGIMCDPDKIAVYTKGQYTSSIKLISIDNDGNQRDITETNPCRGDRFCNGKCWIGCNEAHRIWRCTTEGAQCELEPGYCPADSYWCIDRCWLGCESGRSWVCTEEGGWCL